MDSRALQSVVSFARQAYDCAELHAERAEEAEMMREARQRMRAIKRRDYGLSQLLPSQAMTVSSNVTRPPA